MFRVFPSSKLIDTLPTVKQPFGKSPKPKYIKYSHNLPMQALTKTRAPMVELAACPVMSISMQLLMPDDLWQKNLPPLLVKMGSLE